MFRRTAIALCAIVALLGPATAAQGGSTFKVMTQNMDSGSDFGYVLAALQTDPAALEPAVTLTLLEADASLIPLRAAVLAGEIKARMPHLVALQEVTLWRIGPTPETADIVRWDQLEALMTALKGLGAPYRVVAINTLSDVALPAAPAGAVRYTDRDVLLARSDVDPSDISDVQTQKYAATFTFGPVTIKQGFISALVRANNRVFRIVDTHLQTKLPGVGEAIQEAQAAELLGFLQTSPQPVVLAGDFNADAILGIAGPGPDNTNTVALIQAAGFVDSWAVDNPAAEGATWPLYLEDQPPPFFFRPAQPFERIDLIFLRGLSVMDSAQVGAGRTYPAAASDHTGVITSFRIDR